MKLRSSCILALLLTSLAAQPMWAEPASLPQIAQAEEGFLLVPGQSVGPITKDSTEASLKAAFGAGNVKKETLYVGDGQELPGLAIFANDPEKRIEVIWSETEPNKIAFVQIQGARSLWQTKDSVSLGTSLQELEKLNGRAFTMFGLGWDFGGSVTDWKGGALDGLMIRLGETEDLSLSEKEAEAVYGDQEVSSDLPLMRRINPKVFKIVISFDS